MRFIIFFTLMLGLGGSAIADQRSDVQQLLHELDFLIDSTERMRAQYQNDDSKIRFNYPALIVQLEVTRDRVAEYLNDETLELRTTPPDTVDGSFVGTEPDQSQ